MKKTNQKKVFTNCYLKSIIISFSLCLTLVGCKEKLPNECEEFFNLTFNQQQEVFNTYDLEKQLRIHRCGLDKVPMMTGYASQIANRGEAIIPVLLEKLSTEDDEVTKYAIILVFRSMAAKGKLKNSKEVLNEIKIAVSKMKTEWVKDYSQDSITRIQELIQK